MIRAVAITVTIFTLGLVQLGNGYRILGVFPTPSISHQVVFRGLTLALNQQGHELVVVTTNPVNDPTLKNYTEIDTSVSYKSMTIDYIDYRRNFNFFEMLKVNDIMHQITEDILGHPEVQRLSAPNSTEKFDLMIIELLFFPAILPLAKRFNVPTIGITSLGLTANAQYTLGNVLMPSHKSTWELEMRLSKKMTFWQRLDNHLFYLRYLYWVRTTYLSRQQEIARKYFGNDVPDLHEYEKEVSLVFVNQQGPISYSRPNIPNVIEIGGFHFTKNVTALPKNLQKILDESKQGFVYMSLGSNVKSATLPKETLDEFITAFSRLPYTVLWKFEDDSLENKPHNVHIMKWVPQQAVLAHPNIKVFVYQGGLQSTEEAVAHAVPLVGFPVMTDQDMQVNKMVDLGTALKLEITAVDGNELVKAITTVANDQSYKQRMIEVRSLVEDKPHDPLKNAIWWTEYVIRHKGAPHLRSSMVDEPWYRRQDTDIVAFLTAGLMVVSFTILGIFYRLIGTIWSSTDRREKTKIH